MLSRSGGKVLLLVVGLGVLLPRLRFCVMRDPNALLSLAPCHRQLP